MLREPPFLKTAKTTARPDTFREDMEVGVGALAQAIYDDLERLDCLNLHGNGRVVILETLKRELGVKEICTQVQSDVDTE